MEAAIDFSIWALFSRATLPVQAVMVLLIGLSIWSWTIAINKRIALRLARWRSAKFDKAFWSGEPLDELYDKIGAAPKSSFEAFIVLNSFTKPIPLTPQTQQCHL